MLASPLLALALLGTPASPGEGGEVPHAANLVALKEVAVAAFGSRKHDPSASLGLQLAYERTLVEGVEAELAVAALVSRDYVAVPVDLLVKRSIEPAPWLQLFVGAGPVLNAEWLHEGFVLAPGVIGSTGAYLWFGPHLGVVAELDAALLVWPETRVELEVAFGTVWRF